jgi:DnaJ-class molecular chaperone
MTDTPTRPAPCFVCRGTGLIPGSIAALDRPCDRCRPAPQQAKCLKCSGTGAIYGRYSGLANIPCFACDGTGNEPLPAPQQEQAARFVVTDDADIFDSETKRVIHVPGRDLMAVRDYARAIAAALNASPAKEAK